MTKSRSFPRHGARHAALMADTSRRLRKALIDTAINAQGVGDAAQPPLRVARAVTATAPAALARTQAEDPRLRDALATTYDQYLAIYRSAAPTVGDSDELDDVGHAVAYFVAVCLQALHGDKPDDAALAPLERQLRATARAASNWNAASTAQRQLFFEQIAVTAVLVAVSLDRAAGPEAAAAVRLAARQYLQQMLGVNPNLLTLAPSGLVARAADAAQPA